MIDYGSKNLVSPASAFHVLMQQPWNRIIRRVRAEKIDNWGKLITAINWNNHLKLIWKLLRRIISPIRIRIWIILALIRILCLLNTVLNQSSSVTQHMRRFVQNYMLARTKYERSTADCILEHFGIISSHEIFLRLKMFNRTLAIFKHPYYDIFGWRKDVPHIAYFQHHKVVKIKVLQEWKHSCRT